MKYIISILLLLSFVTLHSTIVAQVGDEQISSEELLEEMQNYEGEFEYTYGQIRKMALQNLIESDDSLCK